MCICVFVDISISLLDTRLASVANLELYLQRRILECFFGLGGGGVVCMVRAEERETARLVDVLKLPLLPLDLQSLEDVYQILC